MKNHRPVHTKKLSLNKQRIRNLVLQPTHLEQAQGGWGTYNCKSGQSCQTDC